MSMQHIRNFSIIAHIDHGKSTLADRIIHLCGGLSDREMEAQVLDSMDIERERGITIKAQTAALQYRARSGEIYNLNLIDTPGTSIFPTRCRVRCPPARGPCWSSMRRRGSKRRPSPTAIRRSNWASMSLPVLNKVDLPSATPDNARQEIEDVIGIDASEAVLASAKTGLGVEDILEAIIERIPAPTG
jgi:GTP-binding protein LepA